MHVPRAFHKRCPNLSSKARVGVESITSPFTSAPSQVPPQILLPGQSDVAGWTVTKQFILMQFICGLLLRLDALDGPTVMDSTATLS